MQARETLRPGRQNNLLSVELGFDAAALRCEVVAVSDDRVAERPPASGQVRVAAGAVSPCGRPEVGRLGGSARARSRRGGPAGHVAHCPGPHMDSACETRARATTPTVLLRPTGAAWPRLRGCAEHARRPPVGLDEPGRMTPGRIRVIRKHRGSPGKETKRRSQCERQQRRPAAPQTGPATAPRPAPPAAPPALPVAEGHGAAGRPDLGSRPPPPAAYVLDRPRGAPSTRRPFALAPS